MNRAIKKAERKTAGEIAVAIIKESYDYAFYELMFGLFCGFIYFFVVMFFHQGIESIIKGMSWDYSTSHLLMFFGFSTFLVIFIFYLIAIIPFIDRIIIPKSVQLRKVNERAVRHFMESGVYNTRDRTGVLIFISLLEHRVELLTDRGISKKIPRDKWQGIIDHIIDGIRGNSFTNNLFESIGACGDLLAEHFPVKADDINELSDDIEVLEK